MYDCASELLTTTATIRRNNIEQEQKEKSLQRIHKHTNEIQNETNHLNA